MVRSHEEKEAKCENQVRGGATSSREARTLQSQQKGELSPVILVDCLGPRHITVNLSIQVPKAQTEPSTRQCA